MSSGLESARGPGTDLASDFSSVEGKDVPEIQKSRSAPTLSDMGISHSDMLGAQHSQCIIVTLV